MSPFPPLARAGLVALLVGVTSVAALAETITFEDGVPSPDRVFTQYCSKGVELLQQGGRIFEPLVYTSSPTHSLTTDFGQEFDEVNTLAVRFTTGQSQVSVNVGLDRAYPFLTGGVRAVLQAYSSDTPGAGLLGSASLLLGATAHPVTLPLGVSSAGADIRSVLLRFEGATGAGFAVEVIDDLTFTAVGPPCGVVDTTAPSVSITLPATDGALTSVPDLGLAFTADDDVGISRIQVQFLGATGADLGSFYTCGSAGAPGCPVPGLHVGFNFYTQLPVGTRTVRVRAWDFTDKQGHADRLVDFRPPGPSANLWAQGLEITQAIQEWVAHNTTRRSLSIVPMFAYPDPASGYDAAVLVADRTTVARLYAGAEATTGGVAFAGVRAKLRCFLDDGYSNPCPGPVEAPSTAAIQVSPAHTLDQRRRDPPLSWNVVLPDAWVHAGTIYLEASVNDPPLVPECSGCLDQANRLRLGEVELRASAHFRNALVHFLRIDRVLSGVTTSPPDADRDRFFAYLRRTYPVDEAGVHTQYDSNWTYTQGSTNPSVECHSLLPAMGAHFAVSPHGRRSAHGLIDAGYPCSGMGGGGLAFSNASRPAKVAAEEIGHAFGLSHAGPPPGHGAECTAGAGGCDQDWPWPHGTIGGFGFDVLDPLLATVYPPDTQETDAHDFMSYGGPLNWVSLRNWTRLFNSFTGSNFPYRTSGTSSARPGTEAAATSPVVARELRPVPHLLVRAVESPVRGWTFLPFYEVLLPPVEPPPDESPYEVRLLDARGGVLASRHVTPVGGHVDMDDPASVIAAAPSFTLPMPVPSGTERVELWEGRALLAARTRSPTPPALQIYSPTAEGFAGQPDAPLIFWEAVDPDRGDTLHALVEYSPTSPAQGGPHWRPLAIDVPGLALPVDLGLLPGGPEALVRVLVSDGMNTVTAVSVPFLVPNKPPRVTIFMPALLAFAVQGDRVVLRGAGSDLEDGPLPPEALLWSSSLEGRIAIGPRAETAELGAGIHFVTLTGTDSAGGVHVQSVLLWVLPPANHQPVAHAGPDQTVVLGEPAYVDGGGSRDADGDPLAFLWTLSGQPPGSEARLLHATSAQALLSAYDPGTYTLSLVIHDGKVASLADPVQVTVVPPADTDRDGVPDALDNCTLKANPDQRDTDADGYGNACDPDFNNDKVVSAADYLILRARLNTNDALCDLNGDGVVSAADYLILRGWLNRPPGPSGLVP
jgi:hypothetical protein